MTNTRPRALWRDSYTSDRQVGEASFDSMSRGMKRKEGNDEGEGNKKARGESSGYKPLMIASVGSTARVVASRATGGRHVT